jgi:hypothetical protein
MWWLYFRRAGKLVGVAIIEAPTLYRARTRVAVRGIGRAARCDWSSTGIDNQAVPFIHDTDLESQTFHHAHASCGRSNYLATWRGTCRTH